MRRALLALLLCCAGTAAPDDALRAFGPASPAQIAEQSEGRPYVLALWSIRCEPCVREMPVWRELRAKHPALRIVLVATDPPEDADRVRTFLARHDPGGVERWQFTADVEEKIRYAVDPKWRGELPRAYFFDASHRPTATTGVVDRAEAERWLAAARSRVSR